MDSKEFHNLLINAKKQVFFTGAVISTASGVPDFKTFGEKWLSCEMLFSKNTRTSQNYYLILQKHSFQASFILPMRTKLLIDFAFSTEQK